MEGLSGDISGELHLQRGYPYDLMATQGNAQVEIQELKLGPALVSPAQWTQVWAFQPVILNGELAQNVIRFSEPVTLVSESGSLQLEGTISLTKLAPELNLTVSGEADLFRVFKQIFHCSKEKTRVSIKGFEHITCF